MPSKLRRALAFLSVVTLLSLSACSDEVGRWQLVPDSNGSTYRMDTTTGDTWRTTGAEWVYVRVAKIR